MIGNGVVVDPWAPRMSRKHRERHGKELHRLHGGDVAVWLERAGEAGLEAREWSARSKEDVGIELGDRRLAEPVVARLQGVLLEALANYHGTHPLSLGPIGVSFVGVDLGILRIGSSMGWSIV